MKNVNYPQSSKSEIRSLKFETNSGTENLKTQTVMPCALAHGVTV